MSSDPDLERDKLQLERERFEHERELENERLEHEKRLEKEKGSQELLRTWLTAGSIVVSVFIPLIVAALTFYGASSNQDRQAKDQLKLQRQQAQAQFELQAAEIVMSSENPEGTYNKARALRALFPGRLPSDFAASFNPDEFASSNAAGIVQSKKELLNLLAENPDERERIIDTWKRLFPEDEWVKDLE